MTPAEIRGLVHALVAEWCWPPARAWSREGSPWPAGLWQDFGLRQEGREAGCPGDKGRWGRDVVMRDHVRSSRRPHLLTGGPEREYA
jgi:hypothetical protein